MSDVDYISVAVIASRDEPFRLENRTIRNPYLKSSAKRQKAHHAER